MRMRGCAQCRASRAFDRATGLQHSAPAVAAAGLRHPLAPAVCCASDSPDSDAHSLCVLLYCCAEACLELFRLPVDNRRARPLRRVHRRSVLPDPVPVPLIWRAFEGILTLPPVDERIIALIAGVDSRPQADLPRQPKGRSFGSR